MDIRLVIEPHASEALKEFVREGLALYNVAATGAAEYYPVCLFLKNEHQEVLGGLLGHIWAQCMHIAILWVAPILRHQGHGTALLQAAEQLAVERGCTLVTLETFSFQAPTCVKAWVRDHRGVARLSAGSIGSIFSRSRFPCSRVLCGRTSRRNEPRLFYDDGLWSRTRCRASPDEQSGNSATSTYKYYTWKL